MNNADPISHSACRAGIDIGSTTVKLVVLGEGRDGQEQYERKQDVSYDFHCDYMQF